jgi:bifunctional DNA primase/polymerase-like protein
MSSPAEACRLAINVARNCRWHTFPCRDDKTPACPHGFYDASDDPRVIRRIWRVYPGTLVGIRTGSTSNIDVLDIDVTLDHGLWWWKDHNRQLLPTRCFETRSGGLHLLYQHCPGLTNTAGKLCAGVDTRSEGGYVISWWCEGFGCFDHTPPQPWPAWLLAELTRKIAPPPPAIDTPDERALAGIIKRVEEAREGERNAVLFWAANRLAERGISQAEAEALLLPAAAIAGHVSFADQAMDRASIGSAYRRRAA